MNGHPSSWLRQSARARLPTAPRPADDFWADFRQRADGLVREEFRPAPLVRPAFAWAAAAALLIAGAALWLPGSSRTPAAALAAAPAGEPEVRVLSSHASLLILKDEETHGLIVWVGDDSGAPVGG